MISRLLRAQSGPLTREQEREPGRFGLGRLPVMRRPDAVTTIACGFCSTGCGLTIHLCDNQAIGLSPATEYPVNLGMACPKGWESLSVLDAPDRAVAPMAKNSSGRHEPISWRDAINQFVSRMKSLQEKHGPHSIAFLGTGQIVTEETAFLGALAKFGMGMLHGDGNTRQCMATSVVAYKQSFGFDAPPYTFADFEYSDVIVLIGANPCIAHPILWQRVMRNPNKPAIIVVDPRTTETAMSATLHLPLAPKSDLTLLYGIAGILIRNEWIDRSFIDDHTTGFQMFSDFVRRFPIERVVSETGLPRERIEKTAELIHAGKRVSFWWTMGVNQSHQGVRTAQAIINLALATGNIGRPGTGANSITGQCNAMGSRLFSNTTSLPGGREYENADHRRQVAEILGIDVERIPRENSLAYNEIMEGILARRIRGLWIVGTNPAHSWINQNVGRDILGRLDFLVVQDMYHSTDTAGSADLILPAAGWGEKNGTFINSERRIGVVRQVRRAPGQALTDFRIFQLIAEAWGCGELFSRWSSPEAVFQILRELSRDRPCDFTGIADYAHIEREGGIQWPLPQSQVGAGRSDVSTERRLFADGRFHHEDGRAKFLFEEPRRLPEPVTVEYPMTLLTGRGSAAQWHTQTRTAKSAVLRKLYPEHEIVEINPDDARRIGIRHNQRVVIESRRGRMIACAVLTHSVRPGQVFVPMHYAAANQLTAASFDPYSKQPAYKACAVRVARDTN